MQIYVHTNILAWHLRLTSHAFCSPQIFGLPLPEQALIDEYMELDGTVPQVLINEAICASTEEEARTLASRFLGGRQGLANTHEFPSVEGE
jgi:hypothetical protein